MLCLRNRLRFYNLTKFFALCSLFTLWACDKEPKQEIRESPSLYDIYTSDSMKMKVENLLKNAKSEMGYRFIICGDFDGDNKIDTLKERYTDSLMKKEVPKYYANIDYFDIIDICFYYRYESFLEHTKHTIENVDGGALGVHYVENCGDINFDGKDEVLVVAQRADMSNLNQAIIYSLINNHWKEIYRINIWEWQFPETPSVTMTPSIYGNFTMVAIDNDSLNVQLENQLKTFRFFTYHKDSTIEFMGRNDLDYDYETVEQKGIEFFLNKDFKKVKLQDSTYFQWLTNPSVYYKAEAVQENAKKVDYLPLGDGASHITVRINLKHPRSPFRLK